MSHLKHCSSDLLKRPARGQTDYRHLARNPRESPWGEAVTELQEILHRCSEHFQDEEKIWKKALAFRCEMRSNIFASDFHKDRRPRLSARQGEAWNFSPLLRSRCSCCSWCGLFPLRISKVSAFCYDISGLISATYPRTIRITPVPGVRKQTWLREEGKRWKRWRSNHGSSLKCKPIEGLHILYLLFCTIPIQRKTHIIYIFYIYSR